MSTMLSRFAPCSATIAEDLEDVNGLLEDCICVARGAQFGDLFDEFVAQRCPKALGVQFPYVGNASCTSNDAGDAIPH